MKTILIDAVNTFVIKGEGVYAPLHALLEQYSNRKIVLSNANDEEIVEFGLKKLPYELFTLKHHPDKIDPGYFRKMLENFHLKPEDVLYFEHNAAAVESARSVGITSFHYDKDKQDLVHLKSFLDANVTS